MKTKEEVVRELADKMEETGAFKAFHGKVQFNFSFGDVKTIGINETLLKKIKN